jgi:hypothetical protein
MDSVMTPIIMVSEWVNQRVHMDINAANGFGTQKIVHQKPVKQQIKRRNLVGALNKIVPILVPLVDRTNDTALLVKIGFGTTLINARRNVSFHPSQSKRKHHPKKKFLCVLRKNHVIAMMVPVNHLGNLY